MRKVRVIEEPSYMLKLAPSDRGRELELSKRDNAKCGVGPSMNSPRNSPSPQSSLQNSLSVKQKCFEKVNWEIAHEPEKNIIDLGSLDDDNGDKQVVKKLDGIPGNNVLVSEPKMYRWCRSPKTPVFIGMQWWSEMKSFGSKQHRSYNHMMIFRVQT